MRPLRSPRALLVAAFALGGVACQGAKVPGLQIPQLQQASELSEYGGERVRAANACTASSETLDAYLQCMQRAGYGFVAREAVYPSNECWRMRDAGDPKRLPPSYCFQRTGAQ